MALVFVDRTQKHYEVFIARALDRVNKKKDKDDDKRVS